MRISKKVWNNYIKRLRMLDDKAAALMVAYIKTHDVDSEAGLARLISYSYAIATKYGEGAAALSAEMYDAVAALSGKTVPPAVPAATASYGETARTVQGARLFSKEPDVTAGAVSRLVKTAGADTTLQNAERDGAEFAWIPSGDTCAFCLTLASQGWQRVSKRTLRNGHAEHIHNNCDCTYAVSFNGGTDIEGYGNGEKYRKMYDNAPLDHWNTPDGKPPAGDTDAERDTPKNRINALRRQAYGKNKSEEINAD